MFYIVYTEGLSEGSSPYMHRWIYLSERDALESHIPGFHEDAWGFEHCSEPICVSDIPYESRYECDTYFGPGVLHGPRTYSDSVYMGRRRRGQLRPFSGLTPQSGDEC